MYLISQSMIYLLLALLVGGGIGYAFRACLADTACDDVRDDLAAAQTQLQEAENRLARAIEKPVVTLPPFPEPPVPQQPVIVASNDSGLTVAPEMRAPRTILSQLTPRNLEAALLAAAPGISPKSRFEADDLTAISGLTPTMDRWLASFGITRLADIESLTPAELYWLVDHLPGDGASVYKDQWIAQASKLLGKA
jgi:predicted flap endonuclease-1-like 5' DNA nuclease